MAALICYNNCPSTSLAATTATTVLGLSTATNQRAKVLGYGLYFDGTSNSAQPVTVIVGAFTSGAAFSSIAVVKEEPELTETVQTKPYQFKSGQTEGTYTAYKTFTVHPQLGYEYLAPLGQEDIVAGATQWGIQINAPATVNVRGYAKFEE
jgi:hypothetical protein